MFSVLMLCFLVSEKSTLCRNYGGCPVLLHFCEMVLLTSQGVPPTLFHHCRCGRLVIRVQILDKILLYLSLHLHLTS